MRVRVPTSTIPGPDTERFPVLSLRLLRALLLALLAVTAVAPPSHAQERKGAFVQEFEDEDGDPMVLMESEWISMRLMPGLGSTVVRFVFRPTQNEIIDVVQPKNVMSGGGLLQDNIWEQDWRFQELRGKWYDYGITKRGPDEVQAVFETKLEGWLGSADSGVKSRLLEDVRIRRIVTLQQGTPYFLFDVELINEGDCAKLPLYWAHNSAMIDMVRSDRMFRPSDRGINEIPGSSDYVYNFNHGWSSIVAPERREGIVYLMDYDYVNFLYNCGTSTSEWVYDNLLILKDRPVRTRIYVIPTMGLERVDHATEHFIVQMKPGRVNDQLRVQYKVTASYSKARKITFVPELVYSLMGGEQERREAVLPAVEFEELGVEPQMAESAFAGQSSDPVIIRTRAFVDLADGTQKEQVFEHFHVGNYSEGRNIRKDLKTPVATLAKRRQSPFVPVPTEAMAVNRDDFKVFAVLGCYSRFLHIKEAVASIPGVELEIGYHPGFEVDRTGLTDFPYDYDRLFGYRVFVMNNAIFDMARYVGMSIFANYLERGGGLVYGGGENVFGLTPCDSTHPVYKYLPVELDSRIVKRTARLNSPEKNHPIFSGVDLSDLPYAYFVQVANLREDLPGETKVLLKAGDQPMIVACERPDGQRTVVVLALPFGDKAENPGRRLFTEWPEWQKLYANVVRYAGRDL